jgi:hypothetical protein
MATGYMLLMKKSAISKDRTRLPIQIGGAFIKGYTDGVFRM